MSIFPFAFAICLSALVQSDALGQTVAEANAEERELYPADYNQVLSAPMPLQERTGAYVAVAGVRGTREDRVRRIAAAFAGEGLNVEWRGADTVGVSNALLLGNRIIRFRWTISGSSKRTVAYLEAFEINRATLTISRLGPAKTHKIGDAWPILIEVARRLHSARN